MAPSKSDEKVLASVDGTHSADVRDATNGSDVRVCGGCGLPRPWALFLDTFGVARETRCLICRRRHGKAPPAKTSPAKTRDAERSNRPHGVRAVTESMTRFRKSDLVLLDTGKGDPEVEALRAQRPVVRGDCQGGERPCPWVGCAYHLFLDVDSYTGSIKYNRPELEPEAMTHSCALDVADNGGATLNEVGAMTNVTRERIRQIEMKAMTRLKHLPVVRALGRDLEKGYAHVFEREDPLLDADESRKLNLSNSLPKFRGAPVRQITDRIGEVVPAAPKVRRQGFIHLNLVKNRPQPAPGTPRFAETVVPEKTSEQARAGAIRTSRPLHLPTDGGLDESGATSRDRIPREGAAPASLHAAKRGTPSEEKSRAGTTSETIANRFCTATTAPELSRAEAPKSPRSSEGLVSSLRERAVAAAAASARASPPRLFVAPAEGAAELVSEVCEAPVSIGGAGASQTLDTSKEESVPNEHDGLSEKQRAVLDAYNANPSPSAVAELLGTTRASVSTTISRLRARGLVKSSATDGPVASPHASKAKAKPKVKEAPRAAARGGAAAESPALAQYRSQLIALDARRTKLVAAIVALEALEGEA